MNEKYLAAEAAATEKLMAGAMPWPAPVLPLKNRRESDPAGWPKMGFMVKPGEPVVITIGNMYGLPPPSGTESYATIAEAMAAGWVVD